MDWHPYIYTDADMLAGKPIVKGTRLAVDFLLGLYAAGWTEQQVLENYPTLTPEALHAVFAFAVECMPARRAQETLRRYVPESRSLSQELIAERRAEARRE